MTDANSLAERERLEVIVDLAVQIYEAEMTMDLAVSLDDPLYPADFTEPVALIIEWRTRFAEAVADEFNRRTAEVERHG